MNARRPRKWIMSLRIEQRYGSLRYVLTFTDGVLCASLFGSFDLNTSPSALSSAAWKVAADWLSHVQAPPRHLRPLATKKGSARRSRDQ